jgi:AcrR family transcriptional regulator
MSKLKAGQEDETELSSSSIELENSFIARMEFCAKRAGSVSALAKRAGISQGGIRRYFSGGEPTRPHLAALAQAAKVSLVWLATGEGSPDQGAGARPQGVTGPTEEDLDLLESVTRTTVEELQRRGLRLEPAAQARLVRVLYRHFASRHEQPDHDTVSNIIDLAAYR